MSNNDLSGSVDMAGTDGPPASLPSGQIVVADVVGTAYAPGAPDAGDTSAPLTHLMKAVVSFPSASDPSDYSNLVTNTTTLEISGCVGNRYDFTSASGKHASPDVNVGTVKLSGWEQNRFALGGAVGGFYTAPLPAGVSCTVSGTTGFYDCKFNVTDADAGAGTTAGGTSASAAFPLIPQTPSWTNLCGASYGATPAAATCVAACDPINLGTVFCQQRLLYTTQMLDGGIGGNQVTITVPGASPYNGATKTLNIPVVAGVSAVKVDGTAKTPATPPAGPLDALTASDLDGTHDIDIEFSCDGSTTKGAGCTGLGPFELVAIAGSTNTVPRNAFSAPALKYGTLNCINQAKRTDSTVHIPKEAINAMLGGANGGTKQTGGSMSLALIRMSASLVQLAPNQLWAAGSGYFSLYNLP